MSIIYAVISTNLLKHISRTIPLSVAVRAGSINAAEGAGGGFASAPVGALFWPISLGVAIVLPPMLVALFDTHVNARSRPWLRPALIGLLVSASLVWYGCVVTLAGDFILGPVCPHFPKGLNVIAWRLWHSIPVALWHAVYLMVLLSAANYALSFLQVYAPAARYFLRLLQRGRDYSLFACLYFPLVIGAALVVPHYLQSKVLFQSNPFFFSRSVKGSALAIAYVLFWFLALMGFIVYMTVGKMLGIAAVASLDPFQCS